MISKIDWLSLVVKLDGEIERGSTEMTEYVMQMLLAAFPTDVADALFDQAFAPAKGRAPYTVCNRRADSLVSVYYGGHQAHVLIEITGGGCEDLERKSQLKPLVESGLALLSRLDVAVDMPVPTDPLVFVGSGYSDRFKSTSSMVSDTGTTAYIGSRDSERYARVYRYNAPHPRAAWLRCEFCLKHENAKATAIAYLESGITEVVAKLGNSFQWRHPAWQPDLATSATMPGWSPERRKGATVRWLLTAVFPALANLVKDGTIEDLDAFLDTNLYTLLE